MDAKSLSKVVLLGGSMIAGSLEGAFAWKCSLGHEHKQDEMCTETGDRPCDACENGMHHSWELCSQTVFLIPSENYKCILVPLSVPNERVASLLTEYKYDGGGKERKHIDPFLLRNDASEVKRLSRYVRGLKKKYLPKEVEDKKEGDENLDLVRKV